MAKGVGTGTNGLTACAAARSEDLRKGGDHCGGLKDTLGWSRFDSTAMGANERMRAAGRLRKCSDRPGLG